MRGPKTKPCGIPHKSEVEKNTRSMRLGEKQWPVDDLNNPRFPEPYWS